MNVRKCEGVKVVLKLEALVGATYPRPPSWANGHTGLNAGVLGETALPRFSGLNPAVAAPTPVGVETQTLPRVQCLGFFRVIILQGLDVESVSKDRLDALEASFSGGDCGHDRDSMF